EMKRIKAVLEGRGFRPSFLVIPDSRFPIPDSRFPIPDSRFPITYIYVFKSSIFLAHRSN
ncbi:hypothetical protein, partial [Tychonema sp. BBK16]|uniref:hypothetical protein n=1 Tax=Tychonema sp. BBK16 TaxID=2699888 RepID=UPI001F23CE8C